MTEEKPMLDHVSIGVRDLGAARRFYDAVLSALGYSCLSDGDAALGYGREVPRFWVSLAPKPLPSDRDTGLHFCFAAKRRLDVDAFHAAALKAGGTDNGRPGLRKDYGDSYYAAFIIDPEGYRLEAFCDRAV